MFKLFALQAAVSIVLSIIGNFRFILGFSILCTIIWFGYLLHQNGLDISLAFGEVYAFWLSVWDFIQRGVAWGEDIMPF